MKPKVGVYFRWQDSRVTMFWEVFHDTETGFHCVWLLHDTCFKLDGITISIIPHRYSHIVGRAAEFLSITFMYTLTRVFCMGICLIPCENILHLTTPGCLPSFCCYIFPNYTCHKTRFYVSTLQHGMICVRQAAFVPSPSKLVIDSSINSCFVLWRNPSTGISRLHIMYWNPGYHSEQSECKVPDGI